jgi:hypothetical protein
MLDGGYFDLDYRIFQLDCQDRMPKRVCTSSDQLFAEEGSIASRNKHHNVPQIGVFFTPMGVSSPEKAISQQTSFHSM